FGAEVVAMLVDGQRLPRVFHARGGYGAGVEAAAGGGSRLVHRLEAGAEGHDRVPYAEVLHVHRAEGLQRTGVPVLRTVLVDLGDLLLRPADRAVRHDV